MKKFIPSWTTNRTNLELKRRMVSTTSPVSGLPIVPIWNWNFVIAGETYKDNDYQSYQSGIETLAPAIHAFVFITTNRTNLELKQYKRLPFRQGCRSTNRTNLELKPQLMAISREDLVLPIVPIWNWNGAWYQPLRRSAGYQSYQSGIETSMIQPEIIGGLVYQSYQSGIETWEGEAIVKILIRSTNRTNMELKRSSA